MIDTSTRPELLTEPITSYDFLTKRMVEIIREEPKRMWMNLVSAVDEDENELVEKLKDQLSEPIYELNIPSCGAVGCIAGWTNMLTRGYYDGGSLDMINAASTLGLPFSGSHIQCNGTPRNPAEELFCDKALMAESEQGSPEFAEKVITHIMNFARKYETILRNHMIQP